MTAKVVAVTGASAGVGRAVAHAFAEAGADVALLARGAQRLDAACAELEGLGARALALPTDVADAGAVERAVTAIEEELGPIDVWVNAAMASVFAPVRELKPEEVRRVVEVTYLGSVNGILAALKRMRERDRGVIIQIGSALAYRGIPLQATYCAAKFAIRGFVDSLRTELLHEKSNVKVTTVHLPGLNTPQFSWVRTRLPRHPRPVPPVFQPEVAAKAVVWAADHPRREMLVGGPTVGTVLGNKLAPGLLDRYLARTGFDAQQTDEPVDPDRDDNLWEPAGGDHRAHGVFDAEARARSWQVEMTMRRKGVGAAMGTAVAGALLARRRLGR